MTLQAVLDELRERPGAGELIPVIDPATEEQISEFADGGTEAVNEAVARAKASFESAVWQGKPGSERAKVMWNIADLIDRHAEDPAHIDSLNMPFGGYKQSGWGHEWGREGVESYLHTKAVYTQL